MKESQIVFGKPYLIRLSNDPADRVSGVVLSKAPVELGKKRSRKYNVKITNNYGAVYEHEVDASRILMPWSQFERTVEYQNRQIKKVEVSTKEQVTVAVDAWVQDLTERLQACTGMSQYLSAHHALAREVMSADVDGVQDAVMAVIKTQTVNVPIVQYLEYVGGERILPSMEKIVEAKMTKDAVQAATAKDTLPVLRAEVQGLIEVEYFATSDGDPFREGGFRTFVKSLITAGIKDDKTLRDACEQGDVDNWMHLVNDFPSLSDLALSKASEVTDDEEETA